MDAAQASPVSAWMAVSREQNDHPLVPLLVCDASSSERRTPIRRASLSGARSGMRPERCVMHGIVRVRGPLVLRRLGIRAGLACRDG